MKKKKREFTLEQLNNRGKTFNSISINSLFIALIGCIIIAIIICCFKELTEGAKIPLLIVYFIYAIFWLGMSVVARKISSIYKKKIQIKSEAIKIAAIKEKSKEGSLKESVIIRDKKVVEDILSRSINKIVIDNIEGPNFVTSVQLEDTTWQSQVYIPANKLISILDEKSKKEMLDYLIKDIKIGNIAGETTEVTINSSCFLYTNPQTTDEELIEMFELKEE